MTRAAALRRLRREVDKAYQLYRAARLDLFLFSFEDAMQLWSEWKSLEEAKRVATTRVEEL